MLPSSESDRVSEENVNIEPFNSYLYGFPAALHIVLEEHVRGRNSLLFYYFLLLYFLQKPPMDKCCELAFNAKALKHAWSGQYICLSIANIYLFL